MLFKTNWWKNFKGIRIIFLKDFDLNIDNKNKLFGKLMDELNRKGLICFYLSEKEKINLWKIYILWYCIIWSSIIYIYRKRRKKR